MYQTAVYFWLSVPKGEHEGAGTLQAEGQTRCSKKRVSAPGQLLLLWPGYYSGTPTGVILRPSVLVLLLCVTGKKAENNLR